MTPAETQPKYRQIADDLARSIASGQPPAGAALPGMRELAERYEVAGLTIRQAIALLRDLGIVDSRGGSGTYVRQRRPVVHVIDDMTLPTDGQPRRSWREVVADAGMVGTQRALGTGLGIPPITVSAALGVDPDIVITWRKRAMLIDDEPVQIATSWYPPEVVAALPILASPERLPRMAPALLAEVGWSIVAISDATTARRASASDAADLGIEPRDPVLDVVRTSVTVEGKVVDVTQMVTNSERLVWIGNKSS